MDGSIFSSTNQSTLMKHNCLLLIKVTEYSRASNRREKSLACQLDHRDANGEAVIVDIENIDIDSNYRIQSMETQIKSGMQNMFAPGGMIDLKRLTLRVRDVIDLKRLTLRVRDVNNIVLAPRTEGDRYRPSTIGTRTVLVVRIVAKDAATNASASLLRDSVFGIDGDVLNLKSQYDACSFGKLKFLPASNDTGIVNGIAEVKINQGVKLRSSCNVLNAAISELEKSINSTYTSFDHVMFCIPPGTREDWIAYAYENNPISVYNGPWCQYVSSQMHEIGHNLNLGHSGYGNEYGDTSGMMGTSTAENNYPAKCFNAPKNWQLGWYADRTTTYVGEYQTYNLKGLVDYGSSSENDSVIIMIPATYLGGSYDYYLSFNRVASFNSDTGLGRNQVLLHKRSTATVGGLSQLITTLTVDSGVKLGEVYITVQKNRHSFEEHHHLSVKVTSLA